MVRRSTPRGRQTWKTFINNHARQVFAMDFLTQTTAFFAVVYIFVVMELGSRRIVATNATLGLANIPGRPGRGAGAVRGGTR
jgi:hypothetical protein